MDLADHVVAGYFLALPTKRHEGFNDPSLIPPEVFTASGCMGSPIPDEWCDPHDVPAWPAGMREEAAAEKGIAAERVAAILEWTGAHLGRDLFHHLCATREVVTDLRRVIGPADPGLAEIGIALPRALAPRLLGEAPTPPPAGSRVARAWYPALPAGIARGEPPAPGGVALGYEPITGADEPGCTWLCGACEKGVHDALGIRTNVHGLIDSVDDAIRACAWIDEDTSRGEPGPGFPWLLIRYS